MGGSFLVYAETLRGKASFCKGGGQRLEKGLWHNCEANRWRGALLDMFRIANTCYNLSIEGELWKITYLCCKRLKV